MPNSLVKSYAKKTGKSIDDVEKKWNEAVKITEDFFGIKQDKFDDKNYAYCTSILKSLLGIKEAISFKDFIKSNLPSKLFIEAVTSDIANNITNTIVPTEDSIEKLETERKKDEEKTAEEGITEEENDNQSDKTIIPNDKVF